MCDLRSLCCRGAWSGVECKVHKVDGSDGCSLLKAQAHKKFRQCARGRVCETPGTAMGRKPD